MPTSNLLHKGTKFCADLGLKVMFYLFKRLHVKMTLQSLFIADVFSPLSKISSNKALLVCQEIKRQPAHRRKKIPNHSTGSKQRSSGSNSTNSNEDLTPELSALQTNAEGWFTLLLPVQWRHRNQVSVSLCYRGKCCSVISSLLVISVWMTNLVIQLTFFQGWN